MYIDLLVEASAERDWLARHWRAEVDRRRDPALRHSERLRGALAHEVISRPRLGPSTQTAITRIPGLAIRLAHVLEVKPE